jgi:spartin
MAHSEPKLLYSIEGISAYHIQNGTQESLTPSGPQTLSLLMVPTSSPFAGLSSADPQSEAPEEDFYLHLHLPPELDLPLPATTQIYHQPPNSYLIPRWDLGPDSAAFTRIEFPSLKTGKCTQEDIDTFETILAQCTAFLERAAAPTMSGYPNEKSAKGALPSYDPSNYKPGEGYVAGSSSSNKGGQIVLIDEENGSVVGELGEGFYVVEDSMMKPGSKGKHFSSRISVMVSNSLVDPVQITLPQDGSQNIGVAPASQEYLEMAMHPAYKNSTLVSKAAAASRLIVTTSGFVGKTLQSQADGFTQKTKPNAKPMTFTPTTHQRIRKINSFSEGAAGLSAKTVGQVSKYAQNIGASLARKGEKAHKGIGPDGKAIDSYKPGLLNKSLMAFSTIADGIDQAGRSLLSSTSTAATTVVGHRYGAEAGEVSRNIGGGFKNVGLVYIDATGVSRRAIIKSVAKGMVVGKVRGGGDLIVGGGDGGVFTAPPSNWKEQEALEGRPTQQAIMSGGADSPETAGLGRATPPTYRAGAGVGEPLEGQYPHEKR